MPEIPFVGGAYRGRSLNLNSQQCQNLFPVLDKTGGKSVIALYHIPGITAALNLGGSLGKYFIGLNAELNFEGEETHYHKRLTWHSLSIGGQLNWDTDLQNIKRPARPRHFEMTLDSSFGFASSLSSLRKTATAYYLGFNKELSFTKDLSWRVRNYELTITGKSLFSGDLSWTLRIPGDHYEVDLFPKPWKKRPKITFEGTISAMKMTPGGHYWIELGGRIGASGGP